MNQNSKIDRVAFLEEQVICYMKNLLVDSPYHVLIYFEKQVNRYTSMLKEGKPYPASVENTLLHLIREYSSFISEVKEYLKIKTTVGNYSSGDVMA
ncbi:hypothetical protein [Mesobacillus foraminis]|uniref:Uncharacterized protein n=1 Tax=Mesobacillus foraminis TaxID=279826 RepID=A0A4R2B135_9BACI|nr:hypothetical protein [Mesobacillus foraminis]TCN19705.1 hypothetical protein EV146_1167 [Mesobacillus foraminis]